MANSATALRKSTSMGDRIGLRQPLPDRVLDRRDRNTESEHVKDAEPHIVVVMRDYPRRGQDRRRSGQSRRVKAGRGRESTSMRSSTRPQARYERGARRSSPRRGPGRGRLRAHWRRGRAAGEQAQQADEERRAGLGGRAGPRRGRGVECRPDAGDPRPRSRRGPEASSSAWGSPGRLARVSAKNSRAASPLSQPSLRAAEVVWPGCRWCPRRSGAMRASRRCWAAPVSSSSPSPAAPERRARRSRRRDRCTTPSIPGSKPGPALGAKPGFGVGLGGGSIDRGGGVVGERAHRLGAGAHHQQHSAHIGVVDDRRHRTVAPTLS